MDPNATLDRLTIIDADLMTLLSGWEPGEDADTDALIGELTEERIELFDALDVWLSTGGFLPDRWVR